MIGTAVLHQCLVREGYPKRLIDGVEVRLEIVHHSMSTQRDDICKPPAQAAAVIAMAYDIANREDFDRVRLRIAHLSQQPLLLGPCDVSCVCACVCGGACACVCVS
jgi:hypothetical protein